MNMESREHLRNCVLLSHSGAGKTTLAEAMLYEKGLITRMGTVESGNTVSDYEEEEIKRGNSVQTSLLNLEWKGTKINLESCYLVTLIRIRPTKMYTEAKRSF